MAADPQWDEVRDELVQRLAGLADGDFVILSVAAPASADKPRSGWLRRAVGGSRADPQPYVQFMRSGEELRGEVSDEVTHVPGTESAQHDLVSSGWTPPQQRPEHDRGENWLAWFAPDDVRVAADRAVTALGACGVSATGPWEWSTG